MSGQTIKDVVIRISLEAGDLSAAKAIAKEVEEAMKAGGGPSAAKSSLGGSTSAAKTADKETARQEAAAKRAADAKKREQQRDEAAAERSYDKIAAAAVRSYSKILAERKKAEKDAEREYDREVEYARRSYGKIVREREQAKKDTAANRGQVLSGVKGMAFMAASQSPDSQSMVSNVVAIEGAYQSLSAVVTGLGVELTAPLIAASGAAAVVVGGLVAVRQSYVFAREEAQRWRESMAKDAVSKSEYHGQTAIRSGQQALEASTRMPDVQASNRMSSVIQGRENLEQGIRSEQATSGRDFGWRQEIRSRAERMHGLGEQKNEHKDRLTQADKQLAALDEKRKEFANKKKNAEGAHASAIKTLKESKVDRGNKQPFEHKGIMNDPMSSAWALLNPGSVVGSVGVSAATGESQTTWAGQQAQGYGTAIAGGMTESQATAKNKQVDEELESQRAAHIAQTNQLKEEETKLDEEALRLGKERQDAAAGILKVTREQVTAAREAAEADQQRVTAANQQLGMMSKGDQNRLKRIDQKAERMEKQRAANVAAGKDEWEGVEQFTHAEMQSGANFDGPLADQIRDQAIHHGEHAGVRTRTKERDKSKQELKDVEAAQKADEPEHKDIVQKQAAENQRLADEIVKGMKEAWSFADLKAKIDQMVKEMKTQFDAWKLQQSSWF